MAGKGAKNRGFGQGALLTARQPPRRQPQPGRPPPTAGLAMTAPRPMRLSAITALLLSLGLANVFAGSLDDVSQPPPTDPSAFSDPAADPLAQAAALETLKSMPEANEGSLELTDGVYGTRATVTSNNALPPAQQTSRNYPTNGKPSPLNSTRPLRPTPSPSRPP
ncbi:hypothetical protein WR25_16553 [Diploscapter pachys]|uniref:Uncharacterized protein n=1 Tax=Diploscapter pachys TaxID=2018661 RepID=A0A2A2M2N0_9BILA|nr:hypothetical protein WR25_16553 [Diploscapter pachys]